MVDNTAKMTYMNDYDALVCQDKTDSATLTTKLMAQHVNYNLD